jgi:hypothetical protein
VAKFGNTNPGQSHNTNEGERWIVWKCFVFPGVDETETRFSPSKAFIVDDLPTFGYPTKPIVSFLLGSAESIMEGTVNCFQFNGH